MAYKPYNVESTVDETHSVNKRKFVVFDQNLVNTNEN